MTAPSGLACWSIWAELANATPTFLVENLVHSAATMVVGPAFVGKTTLIAAVAAAVSRGDAMFAEKLELFGSGRVVVVATDPGEAARWGQRMELAGVEPGAVQIAQWSAPGWMELLAQVIAEPPALFVMDNVLGAVEGTVNDNEVVAKLLHALTALATVGVPVVLLHHPAKPQMGVASKSPMGSQMLTAWPRLLVAVDETADDQLLLTARSNDQAAVAISLTVVREDGHLPTYTVVGEPLVKKTRRKQKAATYEGRTSLGQQIVDDPALAGLSQRAIADQLGIDLAAVQRALKALGAKKVDGVWKVPVMH